MARLVIVFFLLLATTRVRANDTAFDWIAKYDSSRYPNQDEAYLAQQIAGAYLRGVADAALEIERYCIPNNIQYGVLLAVAKAWIRRHPDKQHLAASTAFLLAWLDAYPCAPSQPARQ